MMMSELVEELPQHVALFVCGLIGWSITRWANRRFSVPRKAPAKEAEVLNSESPVSLKCVDAMGCRSNMEVHASFIDSNVGVAEFVVPDIAEPPKEQTAAAQPQGGEGDAGAHCRPECARRRLSTGSTAVPSERSLTNAHFDDEVVAVDDRVARLKAKKAPRKARKAAERQLQAEQQQQQRDLLQTDQHQETQEEQATQEEQRQNVQESEAQQEPVHAPLEQEPEPEAESEVPATAEAVAPPAVLEGAVAVNQFVLVEDEDPKPTELVCDGPAASAPRWSELEEDDEDFLRRHRPVADGAYITGWGPQLPAFRPVLSEGGQQFYTDGEQVYMLAGVDISSSDGGSDGEVPPIMPVVDPNDPLHQVLRDLSGSFNGAAPCDYRAPSSFASAPFRDGRVRNYGFSYELDDEECDDSLWNACWDFKF